MICSTFSLEYSLFQQGYAAIGGIDEVGRGCLAGPVVAAAVVITSPEAYIPHVFDSKLMTRSSREKIFGLLCEKVSSFGIGSATAEEIDRVGISYAASMAMARAYDALRVKPDLVIVDGKHVRSPFFHCLKIDKADQKHYVVSVASVLAKVYRDNLMCDLSKTYGGYGFERHVGYGTREHLIALDKLGVCELHRKTYSPVKRRLEGK